jgi:long-chain fatty acid transport protein
VDLEFEDVAEATGLGLILGAALGPILANPIDLEISIPQAVTVSGYHELNDRLALVASVGWQEWSDFGKNNVTVQSQTTRSFTTDRNFDNTWHVAIGARYRFSEPWLWSVGVAYDSSPVDDEDRTPDMPLDRQIRIGTGLQYDLNEDITIGGAYTFIDAGDAKINQQGSILKGPLKGNYDPNHIHAIACNVIWKF